MRQFSMLALFLLIAAPTEAALKKDLAAMERAYDDTEFEDVTSKAGRVLKHPKLKADDRRRVLEITAFSYFYLKKQPQAEALLKELFTLDPNASVDKRKVTPELALFFDTVKARVSQKEPTPPGPDPTQPEIVANPDVTPETGPVTPNPDVEVAKPAPQPPGFRWYSIFPCGIGHFAQGDYGIGAMFLTLEVALIGTSVAFYWLRVSERQAGDQYADRDKANTFQIVQDVAAFTAIGVGIISLIDSIAFSGTRVWKRSQPQVAPTAMPLPNGGAIGIAGTF